MVGALSLLHCSLFRSIVRSTAYIGKSSMHCWSLSRTKFVNWESHLVLLLSFEDKMQSSKQFSNSFAVMLTSISEPLFTVTEEKQASASGELFCTMSGTANMSSNDSELEG